MKMLVLIAMLCISSISNAYSPCDFKGITVGDKLSNNEIMKKLGVKKYLTNPNNSNYPEKALLEEKYGLMEASRIIDWKIGPYCQDNFCNITGVNVGDNIPSSIFVSFDSSSHQINAIDVTVNQSYWNDIVEIVKKKYGSRSWKSKKYSTFISDYKTKQGMSVDGESLTNSIGGINPKTKTQCTYYLNQFDNIFTHSGPLGVYQSTFEIKMISENF